MYEWELSSNHNMSKQSNLLIYHKKKTRVKTKICLQSDREYIVWNKTKILENVLFAYILNVFKYWYIVLSPIEILDFWYNIILVILAFL